MSVQELESAVRQLRPDQLARFTEWFEKYLRVHSLHLETPPDKSAEDRSRTAAALAESPLVGLWRDRDDLGDSSDSARRLREQAQRRDG